MKKQIRLGIGCLVFMGCLILINPYLFAGESKIIVYGYGENCEKALEKAKEKCEKDKKGEVTFIGLCTEQKDKSEAERWRKDVYCKVKY